MTAADQPGPHTDFRAGAHQAMADPVFQANIAHAVHAFRGTRGRLLETLPEWETWREQARVIKAETLARLAEHLDALDTRVTAAGGHVHWAHDAAEARQIVLELAQRYAVRRIVKSKSSTTSEIELNPALEGAGYQVTETDLGEFIVQLAREEPIHFVAPAIHKNVAQVAALFADGLAPRPASDGPTSNDAAPTPEGLTAAARAHLRGRFLEADMGITGVNFAVAETGTIVIFENEGNARMVTSLPRVHVAVMGMEKVVPKLSDLAVMLRVLPLSATGARMAEYVSLLCGPRPDGEGDGPEAFHLIVLDNGRSGILADSEMRESLQCIRCSACLNVCPVYERAGGHAYGSIYSGPIGAVITPLFQGLERAGDLPFASTLCGACAEVCPVKIDIPRLLLTLRRRVAAGSGHGVGRLERYGIRLYAWAGASERRWTWSGRLLRVLLRPFVRGDAIPRLPWPFSAWTASRDFPAPPSAAFRDAPAVTPGATVMRPEKR